MYGGHMSRECHKCAEEIAENAVRCPHCGALILRERFDYWIAALGVLAMVGLWVYSCAN